MAKEETVLVVEDNAVNMELIRDILLSRGYRVLEAENADVAMEMARRDRPDLVLMDIQLPGLDGLEATRRLRNDPETRSIPIVALTAHAMPGEADKAMDAGCAGFISKPIELRSFVSRVAEFLGKAT